MSLHAPEEHLQRGEEFGESAVYITLRVWCASKNCRQLNFGLLEQEKRNSAKTAFRFPTIG